MSRNERPEIVLRAVVQRRDAALLEVVHGIGRRPLTSVEREDLRGIVAAELAEFGLGPGDEPTTYGLELEGVIDWLGGR